MYILSKYFYNKKRETRPLRRAQKKRKVKDINFLNRSRYFKYMTAFHVCRVTISERIYISPLPPLIAIDFYFFQTFRTTGILILLIIPKNSNIQFTNFRLRLLGVVYHSIPHSSANDRRITRISFYKLPEKESLKQGNCEIYHSNPYISCNLYL